MDQVTDARDAHATGARAPGTDTPAADASAARSGGLLAFPDTAERRLRRALRQLDAALAEQREAVSLFRHRLGELGGAVSRLGDSAQTLRGALAEAAEETRKAQAAAQELVATADMMESFARR